jgi:hypothetical protein
MSKHTMRIGVDDLVSMLQQVEPRLRLSLVLGALTATADELGINEEEALRYVRVALCQGLIAKQAIANRRIVGAGGQAFMPQGTERVGLARPELWQCPLCEARVPSGVKHKHTADDWMKGRKVEGRSGERIELREPELGVGNCAIGPSRAELDEAAREAAWLARYPLPPEEPPTFDESTKRRERVAGEPLRVVCAECGCDTTGGHLIGCSHDGGTPNN